MLEDVLSIVMAEKMIAYEGSGFLLKGIPALRVCSKALKVVVDEHACFGFRLHLASWNTYLNVVAAGVALERMIISEVPVPLCKIPWPQTLKKLELRTQTHIHTPTDKHAYIDSLADVQWPPHLTHLTLSRSFNTPLHTITLPRTLTHLAFGSKFNQCLDKGAVQWPENLTNLSFGHAFNMPLDKMEFPPKLQSLALGMGFRHSFAAVVWPASLKVLYCPPTGQLASC